MPSVRAQAAAAALLDEATQAVVRGESARLSPASLAAAGETIAREMARDAAEALPVRQAEHPSRESPLGRFDPDAIGVDAERFQFKSGGDAAGVTDRLAGVERWDDMLGGLTILWEDKAGRRWIVDGHQGLALARRAKAAGQIDVRLNGLLLREADGGDRGDGALRWTTRRHGRCAPRSAPTPR